MPKPLDSRSKELVANLIRYFEQERDNQGPFLPLAAVRERVAAALCLSKTTVSAISTRVKSNEVLTSPKRKRSRTKSITNPDVLDSNGIRNTICELYGKQEEQEDQNDEWCCLENDEDFHILYRTNFVYFLL
ncbi:uncharacterized protein LOC109536189 isoform X4 [Dendroctonus ponderosae]|uniref:uncharacterized protein LOC109536189 isoform X4 n=1 Tax=Dendroctonus ponderosae TaxID=77166 RepID=UPI0020352333|nr:uncharacterized protein LOC109536189 isoform X4 [Dendroctonus ponderosae]